MKGPAETYLEHIERVCGREATSFQSLPATRPGMVNMNVAFFEDVPEPGYLTAFTLGLSRTAHPEWRFGRPELMICVNSADIAWGMAVADVAEVHRGAFTFSYGQTVNFGEAISNDSEMSGFFLFAPAFPTRAFEPHECKVALPGYDVHLVGAYPMYAEEIEVYGRIGLERFWRSDDLDPWDVRRPRVSDAG